ncbi:hypothetical protein GGS21DRAFT_42073 [Xylaria nigripes]|nr:hypothetical protein GGS21DRAFT_42073 [Xylaria nigripes]
MCLSHCWVGQQPLRTLCKLINYLKSFPWRDLPKTYRDALEFAPLLGIQYLGIDSVCLRIIWVDWSRTAGCGILPENLNVSGTTRAGNPYRLHTIPGMAIKGSLEKHLAQLHICRGQPPYSMRNRKGNVFDD